jgi:hypothetical protein
VTGHASTAEDLVLHGPRVVGFASAHRIAARYGLGLDEVEDRLLEFGAKGWVTHSRFADSSGWHLTDAGRREGEHRLSTELDLAGARETVTLAHQAFLPLNRRFQKACTDWQIRPTTRDPMAANDHTDWGWDERVFRALDTLDRKLTTVTDPLVGVLQRFDGYATRYSAALAKVNAAQPRWIDSPEVDSCHTVWIQLHEDLLSTLGIPRGADG